MNTEQSDKIVYPKLLDLIPFYRCFFVEIIQLHPNNLGTGQKKRSLNCDLSWEILDSNQ